MSYRFHGAGLRCRRALSVVITAACVIPVFLTQLPQQAGAAQTTYDVGPGYACTSLSCVPWQSLKPGDTVAIHWRPAAYNQKIVLSESGTPAAPIKVIGVPGPQGQQPVIDGANATATYAANLFAPYRTLEDLSVIIVFRTAAHPWGYAPSNIIVQGLDIRGGNEANSFTDSTGAIQPYCNDGASGMWVRGNNITVRNNTFEDNGNGLFVGSKGIVADMAGNILVEGNTFLGNGRVNSWRDHQVYSETQYITFQGNHFGSMRVGTYGSQLKDRSTGLVIRYNRFDSGSIGDNTINIEEADDDLPLAQNNPDYRKTYIYGNTFDDGPTATHELIGSRNRPETLYFFNNTVTVHKDREHTDYTSVLLIMDSNAEKAMMWGNIIRVRSETPGATPTTFYLSYGPGTLTLAGTNWISPGVTPLYGGNPNYSVGSVTGMGTTLSNYANDPGFISNADAHLRSGGASVDAEGPAPVAVPAADAVTAQYVPDLMTVARPVIGSAPDLGAYEYGVNTSSVVLGGPSWQFPPLPPGASNGPVAVPTPVPTPVPTATPTAVPTNVPPATPAPPPPTVTGPELVTNGGFETSTTGWSGGAGTLTRVAGGHNSSYAAQVVPLSAQAPAVLDDNPNWAVYPLAGTTCVAKAWVAASAGSVVSIRLRSLAGSTELATTASSVTVPVSGWYPVALGLAITAPTSSVDLKVIGSPGATIRVDNVSEVCGKAS